MITFRSKTDVTDADAIFSEINSRFVAAIMMHGQMADYFDFLGLKGYKRIHEYQHIAESLERRKVCRYYIERHGKIIPDAFSGEVKMIPDGWYAAKSISVGKGTKQKAVEDGFSAYREWEEETKAVYQSYAATLLEKGNVEDFMLVTSLIDDLGDELKEVDKIILDLISTGYDMVHITDSQKELNEKYKKRMKGIEVE